MRRGRVGPSDMGGDSHLGLSSVELVKAVLILAVQKEMVPTETTERDGRVISMSAL
jgi:hypothetical protein